MLNIFLYINSTIKIMKAIQRDNRIYGQRINDVITKMPFALLLISKLTDETIYHIIGYPKRARILAKAKV